MSTRNLIVNVATVEKELPSQQTFGGYLFVIQEQTFALPELTWKQIGLENQVITVPEGSTVRYGTSFSDPSKYVELLVSGTFTATNTFFGRDPVRGVLKTVWLLETKPIVVTERRMITNEPNIMFVGLPIGTTWKITCQAVNADGQAFGDTLELEVSITPIDDTPPDDSYPAPTGMSFMLE